LDKYMPTLEIAYIAVSGAAWTLVGIFVLLWFLRGARRSGLMILAAAVAYAAWFWADRLLVQSGSHTNWPFELVVTVVLLIYTAIVVREPHNAIYFRRESYDRQP
jgi:peptidoglycan/LPS O-acetylase OafA/YrhL